MTTTEAPTADIPNPAEVQQAIIDRIERESNQALGIVVDAWAANYWNKRRQVRVPMVSTEPCSNDTDHGPGRCYDRHGEALCVDCQIAAIQPYLVPGAWISIDVYD
jgi:hypothetical protein